MVAEPACNLQKLGYMEKLFIHKVSRFLLPSSFSCSCHAKNISDVVENSRNLHESAPPKNANKNKKAAFLLGLSPAAINQGRRCPPVTPISVVDSHLEVSNNSSNGGWFSSEEAEQEEEDDDTFFSLSSRCFTLHPKTPRRRLDDLSSSASDKEPETAKTDLQVEFDYYYRRRRTSRAGRKKRKGKMRSEMGYYDAIIEKSTTDPYNDFRTSMVEMIVANQIFGAQDLQRLLHCFLSFNSSYFHRIIVEVFSEIIQTLFSQ
ncbi:transcription repressor OFP7-like [Ipomoea triloba]|uniref:transcription repressor OFP7-like n=1 Tax=Ipomoea triloba TaxID=35885 RepID=UPI00125D231D|nr:transcription repressor OFP7-like [Ipomoea triloba]